MDRKTACLAAATSCREEAERDLARRDLWLQEASKWTALAHERAGHALIICEQAAVAGHDGRR
jgi:NAD(P)H-dependent flavin oxidoreductase YrpB (nitropropane dioxygenase family)